MQDVDIMGELDKKDAYEKSEEAWQEFLIRYGRLLFVTNRVYRKAKQKFPNHPIFEYIWERGFDLELTLPVNPSDRDIFGKKYPDEDWVMRNRRSKESYKDLEDDDF